MPKKEQKIDKLLKLFDEEEFYIQDLIAVILAQLSGMKEDSYITGMKIGDSFYEVSIKRRRIQ